MLHTPQLTSFAYQFVLLPPINDGKPLLPYNVKHNILSLLNLENNVLSLGCSSNKICNAHVWLMHGKLSDCDLHLLSREILGKYPLPNNVKPSVCSM